MNAQTTSPFPNRNAPAQTRRQLTEIKGPEMFQFKERGQEISGYLMRISPVDVKGKKTIQYTVLDENRAEITFLATWDLARKLRHQHVGHFVVVRYLGENSEVKTQGNALREFYVGVDLNDRMKGPEAEITDSDIPF